MWWRLLEEEQPLWKLPLWNPLWKLPLWNPLWKLRDQAPRDETDGVRNTTLLRLFRQRRARTLGCLRVSRNLEKNLPEAPQAPKFFEICHSPLHLPPRHTKMRHTQYSDVPDKCME